MAGAYNFPVAWEELLSDGLLCKVEKRRERLLTSKEIYRTGQAHDTSHPYDDKNAQRVKSHLQRAIRTALGS